MQNSGVGIGRMVNWMPHQISYPSISLYKAKLARILLPPLLTSRVLLHTPLFGRCRSEPSIGLGKYECYPRFQEQVGIAAKDRVKRITFSMNSSYSSIYRLIYNS
jgi:hypothetical protein